MIRRPPRSTLFPSPPLFRSLDMAAHGDRHYAAAVLENIAPNAFPLAAKDQRDLAAEIDDRRSVPAGRRRVDPVRSEEHTSELQSQSNLVCRLLLEKKQITDELPGRVSPVLLPARVCRPGVQLRAGRGPAGCSGLRRAPGDAARRSGRGPAARNLAL